MVKSASQTVTRRVLQKDLKLLRQLFERNACVRVPNAERFAARQSAPYKKGYEVRFTLMDEDELEAALRALYRLDFKPGKPYIKHQQIIQPLYGRAQFERFCELIGYDWQAR